jgi:hypothetical protein
MRMPAYVARRIVAASGGVVGGGQAELCGGMTLRMRPVSPRRSFPAAQQASMMVRVPANRRRDWQHLPDFLAGVSSALIDQPWRLKTIGPRDWAHAF